MTERFGAFSVREGDSVVRGYSIGDDACHMAVRLAKQGRVAADIETAGLAELSYTVKVIIVASDTHTAVLDALNPKHVRAARDAFDLAPEIDFHNSSFDVPPLYLCGAMSLDHIWKVTDTLVWANMSLSHLMGGKGLADLEKSVLGATDGTSEKDRFEQWRTINKYTKAEGFLKASYADRGYSMYAGWDGIITHRLHDPLKEMVIKLYTDHPFSASGADRELAEYLCEREQIVNRVMLRRSAKGLAVDLPLLQREQDRIAEEQADLADGLREFGIDSPTNANQLIDALLKADAIPSGYPVTGQTRRPSSAGENLKKLKHPAADLYHKYYDLNKLFGYYEKTRVLAETTGGRIRPRVGVHKARTGRSAYGEPALHQFTAEAREAVLGDEDLSSLDWSQIEPVLAANTAGDVQALEVYEGLGDLYKGAADAGGTDRSQAKITLLAGMYGQGLAKLAKALEVNSLEEAEEIREQVNSGMPRTGNLIGWATEWATETGLTFTMSGRIIPVPSGFDYKSMNFQTQGGGYDMLSETIVEMWRRGLSDHLHVTMHDETLVSTSVAEEVEQIMRTPPSRLIELTGRTPVLRTDRADLGERWRTPPKKCSCGGESGFQWVKDSSTWICDND